MRASFLALAALLAGTRLVSAQTDPAMVPIPLYTPTTAPPGVDPLTQFAADTNLRFINGAQARALLTAQVSALLTRITAVEGRATSLEGRATVLEAKPDLTPRVVALEARPIVPDLTSRVTTLEARPTVPDLTSRVSVLEAKPVVPDLTVRVTTLEARPILTDRVTALEAKVIPPDLTTRVVALEARPIVPDLTTRVTTLEARPNYTTATLAAAGVVKANVALIQRTTTPIAANVLAISVLVPTILPGVTVTVPGTAVGDSISATFAGTPPTGVLINGAQVLAPNTVLVGFQALQAVTLAAGAQNLNFVWMR